MIKCNTLSKQIFYKTKKNIPKEFWENLNVIKNNFNIESDAIDATQTLATII